MYSNKRILFADDDLDFLEATQLMLLDKGFDVVAATSGPEAVDAYKEIRPDIVFLDIKMPEIDGYEVFSRIMRSDPDARIVFTSSYALDDDKFNQAKSMSLRGLLNKPLAIRDLAAMIEQHSK